MPPTINGDNSPVTSSAKCAVVTGATGFFGSYLVLRLLADGYRVLTVVRNRHDGEPQDRLESSLSRAQSVFGLRRPADRSSLLVHRADVTQPDLALSSDQMRDLRWRSPEIWHCAADTSLTRQRTDLFRANLDGTRTLLGFASSVNARRFHFLSTCFVSGDFRGRFGEVDLDVGQRFRNAYEESKFGAEQLVSDYYKSTGLPTTIYRPGIIVGDSEHGRTWDFKGFYAVAKLFTILLKSVGLSRLRRIVMDPCSTAESLPLVPIDYAVQTIVNLAADPASIGRTFFVMPSGSISARTIIDEMLECLAVSNNAHATGGASGDALTTGQRQSVIRRLGPFYPYLESRTSYAASGADQTAAPVRPLISREFVRKLIVFASSCRWGSMGSGDRRPALTPLS